MPTAINENAMAGTAPAVDKAGYPAGVDAEVKAGFVVNKEIGDEKNQKDYYDKAKHYDTLWGLDNIHLGYYPHLSNRGSVKLTFPQAGQALTRRMIEVGGINHESKVLDLGCGKGLACKEIAELTGAACTGLDLGTENIERANEIAKENPHLKLDFLEGSFTELPKSITDTKYTHVIAQVSFCHVHKLLPDIFSQVKEILTVGGGVAIINDYLGSDGVVSEETLEHVRKRLHFETLHGHKQWRLMAEEAGLAINHYEDLDKHMELSYTHLAECAETHEFKSADGVPISINYRNTVKSAAQHEIGMNLAVLRAVSEYVEPEKKAETAAVSMEVEEDVKKGLVVNKKVGEEANQKDYYDKAKHYDTLWGLDNIHLGYYPHLANKNAVALTFPQAGQALTRKMIELGGITHESKVLDLGCGKGLACKEIAELTGAACTGLDLGTENIKRANQIASENPNLKLTFVEGSFTELPKSVLDCKYTHVIAQVSFCHVHKLLPLIFGQVKEILTIGGGKAVINDYLGSDGFVSEETLEHVRKRLHFETLHGHKKWRHMAEDAGLVVQHYEDLDKHMETSYTHLADCAEQHGFKSADGVSIAINYRNTVTSVARHEIGMNLAVLGI